MNIYHEDYLNYLTSEKCFGANTIDAYSRDSRKFLIYCEDKKIIHIKKIKEKDIIAYMQVLRIKNFAPATIYRNLMVIKSFFTFMKRESVININPTDYLDFPKNWEYIPEVLSIEEVNNLLSQPYYNENLFEQARDRAILEMLYATGMRVSELCNLKIDHYQINFIKVNGKGNKERILPLGYCAIESLEKYFEFFENSPKNEYLFRNMNDDPITRNFIWKMIKKYAKWAGIDKKISPHTLRHTCATHLMNGGADIRIIQEILGHESINSTQIYLKMSLEHLVESFNKYHPRG